MKIISYSSDILSLFTLLKSKLAGNYRKEGFEHTLSLNNKTGEGNIISYDFGDGFNLIHFNLDLYILLHLEFQKNADHFLRYIFSLHGDLIHSFSNNIRYRLTRNTATVVASKDRLPELLVFPAQNNLDIFLLQIDTKRFSVDLKKEFMNLPGELGEVLINKKPQDHFFYHTKFTLNIAEAIDELLKYDGEGLVKRFFMESKALELLAMQTERIKNEAKEGYNRIILRRADVELIKKAREYIRNNFHHELTLISLARSVGTNETKLKAGLKKMYGKTFTEILRDDRLLKAKHLLEEKQLSVKEISLQCGYKSVSMFGKRYKEKFGYSPGKLLHDHQE